MRVASMRVETCVSAEMPPRRAGT